MSELTPVLVLLPQILLGGVVAFFIWLSGRAAADRRGGLETALRRHQLRADTAQDGTHFRGTWGDLRVRGRLGAHQVEDHAFEAEGMPVPFEVAVVGVPAVVADPQAPTPSRVRALRALETAQAPDAVERAARAALDDPAPAAVDAALRLVARSPYGYRLSPHVRALAADGPVAAPVAAAVAAHVTSADVVLLLDLLARAADAEAAGAVAERLRALAGPAAVPRLDALRDHAHAHVRRAADAVLAAVRDRSGTGAGALSLADPGVGGGLTLSAEGPSGGVTVAREPESEG